MKTITVAAVLVALPLAALAQEPAATNSAGTSQGTAAPGRHHDRFAEWDTNGDGQISREEAQAAGAARALKRFDKLDLNKDGVVTREEIQHGAPSAGPRFTRSSRHASRQPIRTATVL
jgi:hypothetical protein